MNFQERHNEAIDLAERAYRLSQDDPGAAKELFASAFEIERTIAQTLEAVPENEPSRSILYRLSASLAFSAGLYAQAMAMATVGLNGTPPGGVLNELKAVYAEAREAVIISRAKSKNTKPDTILEDANLIHEATEMRSTIVHVALSSSDPDKGISLTNLGRFSTQFQKLIDNFYKKVYPRTGSNLKYLENNYSTLRPFAGTEGSYKLHLKAESFSTLFHQAPVTRVLEEFTYILESGQRINEPEAFTELLQRYTGHALSTLRDFTYLLATNDIN